MIYFFCIILCHLGGFPIVLEIEFYIDKSSSQKDLILAALLLCMKQIWNVAYQGILSGHSY